MAAPTTERPIIAGPATQQPTTAEPAGFTTQQEKTAAPAVNNRRAHHLTRNNRLTDISAVSKSITNAKAGNDKIDNLTTNNSCPNISVRDNRTTRSLQLSKNQ